MVAPSMDNKNQYLSSIENSKVLVKQKTLLYNKIKKYSQHVEMLTTIIDMYLRFAIHSLLLKFVQVMDSDKVKKYDCEHEPPFYAATLEPNVNVNSTLSDLKQCITINGIKKPNTLLISRMAEKVPIPNGEFNFQ